METNWRQGHLEADLIAYDGEILVFIEVKTRRSKRFGSPVESVTGSKQAALARAAAAYMTKVNHQWEIRFDVVSILLEPGKEIEIFHYKDAFFPGV